jgi:hypothetical protein
VLSNAPFSSCSHVREEEKLIPLDDEELARGIAILAAHIKSFPGKSVRTDRRDDARSHLACELVRWLRTSNVRFFKVADRSLMLNTGHFSEHKR